MDPVEEIEQDVIKSIKVPAKYLYANIISQATDNLLAALFGICLMLGLLISVFFIIIILKKPSMRTSRNILFINTCILNIIYCLVVIISTLLLFIKKYDVYWTSIQCQFHSVLHFLSLVGFPLSVTGILLDRILEIHCRSKLTSYSVRPLIFIPSLWFVVFAIAVPQFFYITNIALIFQFDNGDTTIRFVCHQTVEVNIWYLIIMKIFSFVIPLLFVLYLVILIVFKYRHEETILHQDSCLLYILIVHLILFLTLSLPLYVVETLLVFKINISITIFVRLLLYFFFSLPSMFIPFLYSIICDNVCQEVKTLFKIICGIDICPCIKTNNQLATVATIHYNRLEDDKELESIHNPIYIDYHQPSQESEDILGMLRRLS